MSSTAPGSEIQIVDTTLREGEQSPGVYLPPGLKLEVARALDAIGVDVIEIGNPMAHPAIAAAIKDVAAAGLRAHVAGHARCRIADVDATLECGVDFLGVFLSVADRRLFLDYGITLSKALDRIQKVVAYAKAQSPELVVRFTPEDAVRSCFDNVVAAAVAAIEAGADVISVADTTGYMLPTAGERNMGQYVARLVEALDARGAHARIAVHCHNDRGVALANALQACASGAELVDVSVLGLGERAGIVDLLQLLANLAEMPGCEHRWRLDRVPALYELVSASAKRPVPHNFPIAGRDAFTDFLGYHPRAVHQNRELYSSVDPERFGREPSTALGVQSGRASVELALEDIGRSDLAANPEMVARVLREVKWAATRGESVELLKGFLAIVWRCEKEWRDERAQAAGDGGEDIADTAVAAAQASR